MASLEVLAYTFGVLAVVLFGAGACAFAVYREVKQGGPDTPDFFLTARKSVPMLTIAWSFYAGAMGSWALFGPPSYCAFAGTLGMIMYSISAGLPIIVVAYFGAVIHRLVPSVVSMADYVRRRFGLVISLYVSGLMLFNMGVAITAEYTAVGTELTPLPSPSSPTSPPPPGGHISGVRVCALHIHLLLFLCTTTVPNLPCPFSFSPRPFPNHQDQACISVVLVLVFAGISVVFVLVLFIFVCATFDAPLGPLPSSPVDLTWSNELGLASIGVMPISLISSTLFSEAMWQRPASPPLQSCPSRSSPPRSSVKPCGGGEPSSCCHPITRHCGGEQRFPLKLTFELRCFSSPSPFPRCWASANRKALLGGAALASVAVTIVVFLFGFGVAVSIVVFLFGFSGMHPPALALTLAACARPLLSSCSPLACLLSPCLPDQHPLTRRVGRRAAAQRRRHPHHHHHSLPSHQPLHTPAFPFHPHLPGLLAVWGGVWQPNEDMTNTNTILFSLFNNTTWILVIATVLAVVMSESAVDSLQNAIADTLTTAFLAIIDFFLSVSFDTVEAAVAKTAFMAVFEAKGIWAIRVIVLLFNIPPLVVALKGYNVLQLFLLANLLTTTSVIPVLAGVIPGKWTRKAITPFSVGFGCLSGIASLFIWTQIYSVKYDMSYSDSLYQVFLFAYDYPPFLMALGFSVTGMVVGAGFEAVARVVLKKEYPEFDLGSEELPEVQGGEMADAAMEKLGMGDGGR
ncbi:unnamed protein product [Closterium sp. Naga37s-1]|nr:unnamed protein product [Closterium sp. Naga37s-1]